ncbi:MAG: dimethylsulfonioproprionate lyase family protein [Pseudomonadota bacterium]
MGKKNTANRFLKAVRDALLDKLDTQPSVAPFVSALDDALKAKLGKSPKSPDDLAALAHLSPLLDDIRDGATTYGDAIAKVASAVGWYSCYPDLADRHLADGMLAAHVCGPAGIVQHPECMATYFLLAPEIDYPLHDHRADELYFVASGNVAISTGLDGDLIPRTTGDAVVVPSGMPHRLKTTETPALLLALWIGEITCPVFWYEKAEAPDTWRRYHQRRGMEAFLAA